MTTDELFEAFGGKVRVMEITRQTRNTVNHWRNVGVPWRHWPLLKREAVRLGVAGVTDEALEETRPVNKTRRKARPAPRCQRAA